MADLYEEISGIVDEALNEHSKNKYSDGDFYRSALGGIREKIQSIENEDNLILTADKENAEAWALEKKAHAVGLEIELKARDFENEIRQQIN